MVLIRKKEQTFGFVALSIEITYNGCTMVTEKSESISSFKYRKE